MIVWGDGKGALRIWGTAWTACTWRSRLDLELAYDRRRGTSTKRRRNKERDPEGRDRLASTNRGKEAGGHSSPNWLERAADEPVNRLMLPRKLELDALMTRFDVAEPYRPGDVGGGAGWLTSAATIFTRISLSKETAFIQTDE